jgi:hypothetical protein
MNLFYRAAGKLASFLLLPLFCNYQLPYCKLGRELMKGAMKSKKLWLLFVLLLILCYYTPCLSIAGDTLSAGHSLSYSKSETILSRGSNFELGFFKPGTTSNIYLGIWYKKFDEKDIVWVANRENPLSHPSSSKLLLSQDGNCCG